MLRSRKSSHGGDVEPKTPGASWAQERSGSSSERGGKLWGRFWAQKPPHRTEVLTEAMRLLLEKRIKGGQRQFWKESNIMTNVYLPHSSQSRVTKYDNIPGDS